MRDVKPRPLRCQPAEGTGAITFENSGNAIFKKNNAIELHAKLTAGQGNKDRIAIKVRCVTSQY